MSSNKRITAGVAGVGSMGRHHARVYGELHNVNLVEVFDADVDQANKIAEKNGTETRSVKKLAELADVVSIAVPTTHHYELTTRFLECGVHILVEKPFVSDVQNGAELIEIASENDALIQVGHIERFNPAVRELQDIVPDLEILSVNAERLGPPLDRNVGDNVVMDLMIHDIDLLDWLIGEKVASMSAYANDATYATATFQFEGGAIGTLTASRVTQQKLRTMSITAGSCHVTIDYTNQTIEIHRHSLSEYVEANGDIRFRHESIVERPMVENVEPLKNELQAFISVVEDGSPPIVSAEDGIRAVEWAQKIERRVGYRGDVDDE